MSESRTRRSFTVAQKAEVVRRHLAGKEKVSDLADELHVQPGLIYLWHVDVSYLNLAGTFY